MSAQRSPDRNLCSKRIRQEPPVHLVLLDGYEWLQTTRYAKNRGVDTRWRRKGSPCQTARDRDVVPGSPARASERGRPDGGVLGGEVPLHDEIGSLQASVGIPKEMTEDRPGVGKRQVGNYGEAIPRPEKPEHVGLDHPDVVRRRKAPAELPGESSIDLDRLDPRTCRGEGARQDTGTGADLDDEVSGRDSSFADKRRGESAATKKMLARRDPRGSSPDGHGRPPWS